MKKKETTKEKDFLQTKTKKSGEKHSAHKKEKQTNSKTQCS